MEWSKYISVLYRRSLKKEKTKEMGGRQELIRRLTAVRWSTTKQTYYESKFREKLHHNIFQMNAMNSKSIVLLKYTYKWERTVQWSISTTNTKGSVYTAHNTEFYLLIKLMQCVSDSHCHALYTFWSSFSYRFSTIPPLPLYQWFRAYFNW